VEPRIVFEDTHLAVIDKPAGLLTQGDHSGDPSVVDWARLHFGRSYVGLIHRLDRGTSGLLVIAKRSKSANRLTLSLQEGQLKRTYLALIEGALHQETIWRHHLKKHAQSNTVRVVQAGYVGAKHAALKVTPLESREREGVPLTLARFELETGRSHQIRVQSSHEGHPLVGDTKYGSRVHASRVALHSALITLPHPMSGEILQFESALPADFGT
jgi:23S rRNA pseudouridine1911/1915/1917 synthase